MAKYNVSKDEQKEAIAEFLLRPFRLVRDPVHGDIWLTRLESTIVDQPLFQRLRGIRQLAVSHLVYPGALHTRFDHSLGTLFVADKIAREAKKNCGSRGYLSNLNGFYPMQESDRLLIRLTALLHDAAHFPFGHLIEDEAGFTKDKQWADGERRKYLRKNLIGDSINKVIMKMKEELVYKRKNSKSEEAAGDAGECDSSCQNDFNRLVKKICSQYTPENRDSTITLIQNYLKQDVESELLKVLKAEEEGSAEIQGLERPFIAEAVGDTICADLLDYLARDAHFTGIEERYDRRIYSYFITFKQDGKPRMGLLIKKKSKGVRIDAARYIVKLLDMRYALAEMVYTHPAKRTFSALASSMFGSWVMSELREAPENGGGLDETIEPDTIQEKAKILTLKMITNDELNTDDALLTTLMTLSMSGGEQPDTIQDSMLDNKEKTRVPPLNKQQWMERTAAFARAIKYREKWRRKQLENFYFTPTGGIHYKNPNVQDGELANLRNITGAGRMLIEEELERLLRKLFVIETGNMPTNTALVSIHVPKVFKPKEADVNVVLTQDHGEKKVAYAGPFKFLREGSWGQIKQINERGSLEGSDRLKKQAKLLEPMLGILDSIADATVKLTVAEYYLHPEADEFLNRIEAESEFTELVSIIVALRRTLSSVGQEYITNDTSIDTIGKYYKRLRDVLIVLASKAGAERGEQQPEQLAAYLDTSQIPTYLQPADYI